MRKRWRCFHCDEVFTNRRDAWAHFGDENCETDPPACIDPLRSDEQARMKELREAREHAMKMQHDMEEMDNDVGLLHHFEAEIGRLFGMVGGVKASTPSQAWLVLDSEHGKVLAAEAALLEMERQIPATFFADRKPAWRLRLLVEGWQKAILVNQQLEARVEEMERQRDEWKARAGLVKGVPTLEGE